MAIFVLTGASVTVNTVDLSTYVQSVTVQYSRDSIETTAMGATGHVFTGGLQSNSITLELQNDEAVGKTMETLFAATGSGTNTLVVKNTSTGATFTASNMFLEASTPVVGSVGELSVQSVTFTGGSIVKT
jgi:hypothetical protein